MRLIDADLLRDAIYHDVFETETSEQRWDSGLWIRYRLFERNIESAQTIEATSVVRCKDCRFFRDYCHRFETLNNRPLNDPEWFCADGEKKYD